MSRTPYMLVIGEKEIAANSVSVRKKGKGDLGMITIDDLVNQIRKEIEQREG
jgi:threonyl-tRNA synthetase